MNLTDHNKMLAVGITCLLFAAGTFYLLKGIVKKDAKMRSWPTTQGIIKTSTLEIKQTEGIETSNMTKPFWSLNVTFSYTVAGASYEGNQLSNNPPSDIVRDSGKPPNKKLLALAERYPKGSTIPVHYNPDHPQQSYIFYRRSSEATLLTVLTTVFTLVGVLATGAYFVNK